MHQMTLALLLARREIVALRGGCRFALGPRAMRAAPASWEALALLALAAAFKS